MKKQMTWCCMVAVLVSMSFSAFAGWKEDKADFYAEFAAKEFYVTAEQQQMIRDAVLAREEAWGQANALKKSGDNAGYEKKRNELMAAYKDVMMQIFGKQLASFEQRAKAAFKAQ